MITTGSKWFFGVAAAAFVAALVYGGATNPSEVGMSTFTGVLTLGYKGGVGDQLGYSILIAIAGASLFLGGVSGVTRDASIEASAAAFELDDVPEIVAPVRGSFWPVVGAFGVATIAIGLATDALFVMFGLAVVTVATFEWAITAWSERVTDDQKVNAAARRRVMLPFEVPLIGAIGIAIFVLAVSRMLLALPHAGVYALFIVVPVIVLTGGFLLAAKPRVSRSAIAIVCVVGGLAILAGGIASVIVGPREIEHHEPEGEHEGAPTVVVVEGLR